MAARTTDDVLRDHLRRRQAGDFAGGIAHNYAPDVVILCKDRVLQGHGAVRESARQLTVQVPDAHYAYLACHTHGENGFLWWRAEAAHSRVACGAGSDVVRDGLIRVQTIHDTVVVGAPTQMPDKYCRTTYSLAEILEAGVGPWLCQAFS